MRNDDWLKNRLESVWTNYFKDIKKANEVKICFGKKARTRLGSIRMENNRAGACSLITITGYFKDEKVPEIMIDSVIAHELCHYAHGFSSPLPQLFEYPHQGKAVDTEMIKRGMGDLILMQKRWLRTEWKEIVGPVRRTTRRKRRVSIFNFFNI